ncbi:SAM-dependent methyltransferase [Trichloromonas sp.]|uniref:SAM-dependent methyltransferase n=1 Tax=Trichloromonas sp. TaxID=3069249 RepID=UPI003D81A87E
MADKLVFIGTIETPYARIEDCPRNIDSAGPLCRLRIEERFVPGLLGLEAGQSILILYWLGGGDRSVLRMNSRKSGDYAGVFALRTPNRPNPIGAAVLPIESIDESGVTVRGLDCISGTPLLDIKPAIQAERSIPQER